MSYCLIPENLIDRDAEASVLGSMLINPSALHTLDLRPEEFFEKKNQAMFRVMRKLAGEKKDVDVQTLFSELKTDSGWKKADIYQLASATPTSMHADSYAKIVREKARRRAMYVIAQRMQEQTCDLLLPVENTATKAVNALTKNAAVADDDCCSMDDMISEFLTDLFERANGEKEPGLMTGFTEFDRNIHGLQQGTMTIISGAPSAGKSMLAMQMAVQMSLKHPGVIYSMEMGRMSVIRRMVSAYANVATDKYLTGTLNEVENFKSNEAMTRLSERKLWINDRPSWNPLSLKADLIKQKIDHGIKFFVLDYMYFMDDAEGEQDEVKRTGIVSRELKKICKELNLAGIVIHSLNKAGMDDGDETAPSMSHLRGSGQIPYDVDMYFTLKRAHRTIPECTGMSDCDLQNARVLYLVKGRELAGAKRNYVFEKAPLYPLFLEKTKGY